MIEPGILLGLGSAAAWGSGDFAGGLAARRAGGMTVAAGSQVAGLALLLIALVVLQPAAPSISTLLLGALGGVAGGIGLAALYAGLAVGAMGIVAAVSGVGGVIVPLAVASLLWHDSIEPIQLAGIGCALAAVAAASGVTAHGANRRAIMLALVAALGFGLWFVFLDRAAEQDKLWALVASRGSASLLIGAMALPWMRRSSLRAVAPLVGIAGLMDVAANGMVVLAFATIPVGIAAALSGTYPLATMLLARVLLGEALPRLGLVAVVLAVAGIILISLGT
ncbi:MAG: DMT family transporter [Chloroflexota bacterium]